MDTGLFHTQSDGFTNTVQIILDLIQRHSLSGAVFVTGHSDPDGSFHNWITYQPNKEAL